MGEQERLSPEVVAQPTLLAAEHVHRYGFAAELCRGARVLDLGCGTGYGSRILRAEAASVTGIDIDAPTIEQARATIGATDDISFETADAVEYLRGDLSASFDAIVAFEVLEHLRDVEVALELLSAHTAAGVKLIVSVPNSRAFDEANKFHLTDFGFEEAMLAFDRFEEVTVLYQYFAEGSVIQGEDPDGLEAELVLREHAEREYANNFIACVNFGSSRLLADACARVHLAVAANLNRSMLGLANANRELHRINVRLARDRLGAADSAAAALMQKARESDEVAEEVRRALDKPRYRFVDAIRARLGRVPGLDSVLRRAGRRLSR
jgi:SAM-dependent methyltransferase